ncbi:unnamed protein product [Chrysodeixis includens]|uniref:Aquaporin n=1 Tax=Chrysodeixis includens TaxID=689277 RepID=A0A9N8PZP4_CHRIL|nr:unnamed protein product [Chrysodeixis includens]
MRDYKTVLKQLISEFLGTFLYLAIVLSAGIGHGSNNVTVVIALSNGFVVSSIIYVFGHVSGSHINPAVTVGALVCEHIKPLKALFYVAMHAAGSVAGAAVAHVISAESIRGNLGATIPYEHSSSLQTFLLEFLMTFLLVAVVLSVLDPYRGAKGLGSTPLAIGVCIAGCICSGTPYTGSLNPVRTLGPAVIMGIWKFHWGYWAATMLGGFVAGLVYRFILRIKYRVYQFDEQ